jgi:methylmalonyl-CoA mutase N-terminal domain/subunit
MAGGERERLREERERWERESLAPFLDRSPERRARFETASGRPLERVYTAEHAARSFEDEGFPGEYPFLRGPYPTMYRARPWTMRQIAGFGEPEDTNARLRYLIDHGQTGISIDFDMPTLMGLDSDDERAYGEVGREGVAIDHVDDLHRALAGIDIGEVSVSMTINPSAWILLAMFLVVAEERGVPWEQLSGTTQADIVKEYIAQKEWVYPVGPSLRIVRDMIVFGTERLPRWNPVSISGYHIREAGSTAVQEVAFTIAAAIAYAEETLAAGVPFDAFAPRFAFYFIAHSDFLEEVAKFRAARRLWARIARERFGAQRPESMRMRFHCQTAGSSLTAPQPLNNIARGALQALSAVLGGAQSLHVSGMDEALAIPSELAMKVSLRTQQIILEETGAASTIDALGGSYAIEALTDGIEEGARAYLDEIDRRGGVRACIESGYFQQEIADAAYAAQLAKESGLRVVVGVNAYREEAEPPPFPLHQVDPDVEPRKVAALRAFRASRDAGVLRDRLDALCDAASSDANLMPVTIEAVRARATGGEIVEALRAVLGSYVETVVF